ncbi:type II toxin-antitoxin system PemK/MazF family toxin [Candidatus Dojkabacteria bacterium]|jgi:mRNA interferase MazF|nr:type II toxin-antitoxin system PemK/MazF family toxin [Candidatus Dojkabacteria bacterium]
MEYFKDFENWNELKKKIDSTDHKPPYFNEGDVWWTYVGINIGFEEDGKKPLFLRPVLVVKKFNPFLFIGISMSTKLKNIQYYRPIKIKDKKVSVIISQIRSYSSKRLLNKLSEMEKKDFRDITNKVRKYFPSL